MGLAALAASSCRRSAGRGIKKAGGPIWPTARGSSGVRSCRLRLTRERHRSPARGAVDRRNASGKEIRRHHSSRLLPCMIRARDLRAGREFRAPTAAMSNRAWAGPETWARPDSLRPGPTPCGPVPGSAARSRRRIARPQAQDRDIRAWLHDRSDMNCTNSSTVTLGCSGVAPHRRTDAPTHQAQPWLCGPVRTLSGPWPRGLSRRRPQCCTASEELITADLLCAARVKTTWSARPLPPWPAQFVNDNARQA